MEVMSPPVTKVAANIQPLPAPEELIIINAGLAIVTAVLSLATFGMMS